MTKIVAVFILLLTASWNVWAMASREYNQMVKCIKYTDFSEDECRCIHLGNKKPEFGGGKTYVELYNSAPCEFGIRTKWLFKKALNTITPNHQR